MFNFKHPSMFYFKRHYKILLLLIFSLVTLFISLSVLGQKVIFKKKAAESGTVTLTIDVNGNQGIIKPIWRTAATWKTWVWRDTGMVKNNPPINWFKDYFPFYDALRSGAPIGGNLGKTDDPAFPDPDCDGVKIPCKVPEILKEDGTLDYSYLDDVINNMKKAGVSPVLDLAQSPKALRANDNKCLDFAMYSSPIKQTKIAEWQNYLNNILNHYKNYSGWGNYINSWGFSSFNEPDSGSTTNLTSCSFSGTEEEYVRDVLVPTLNVLKNQNLLGNFHLGSMIGVTKPGRPGATPQNDNDGVSSSEWIKYLVSQLKSNGFQKNDFKSFGLNMYGVYPNGQSLFWINDSLGLLKNYLSANDFLMPIRADELGIIYNGDANTPLYRTGFSASWFASVFKIYLDKDLGGNGVDQISSWWYLLIDNKGFNSVSTWKRNLPYYTFLMFHQLSNNQRLNVNGGIFDRNSGQIIDAVAAKDSGGIVKVIVFNHNDLLSGVPSTYSDPEAPIIDKSDKAVVVAFNNLEPGDYQFVNYQATLANIASSPGNLSAIDSKKITVPQSGTYQISLNMPHHTVSMLTLQKSFDSIISVSSQNSDAYFTWTTVVPTTSYIAYSDLPTGFTDPNPANWGKWRYNIDNANAAAMKTNHSQIRIGGLIPGTTYYYRVAGRDSPKNGILYMQMDVKSFVAGGTTPGTTLTLSCSFKLSGVSVSNVTKAFEIDFHSATADKIYPFTVTSGNSGVFSVSSLALTGLTPGSYTVYIRDISLGSYRGNHLRKNLGSITLAGESNTAPLFWGTDPSYFLKPGDVVRDGTENNVVNITDIAAELSVYTALSVSVNDNNRVFDINSDGRISVEDVFLVLGTYTSLSISGD